MTETFKTSKGFDFQKVEGGWKDLATNLIWFEEIKTGVTQYDAEKWAVAQGKKLPTKGEFWAAELHGIRELPMKWEGFWFWSSTLFPDDSASAYGFNGVTGDVVSVGYCGSSYGSIAVRLVSELTKVDSKLEIGEASNDADKIKKARELLKQALEVLGK